VERPATAVVGVRYLLAEKVARCAERGKLACFLFLRRVAVSFTHNAAQLIQWFCGHRAQATKRGDDATKSSREHPIGAKKIFRGSSRGEKWQQFW